MISLGASSNGVAISLLIVLCLLFVWLAISIAITITNVALQKRRLVGSRFITAQDLAPKRLVSLQMHGLSMTVESDKPIKVGSWVEVASIKGNRARVISPIQFDATGSK